MKSCNDVPCNFGAGFATGEEHASAHAYVAKIFRPATGFATSQGEQAACLLDKTQAYADLVAAVCVHHGGAHWRRGGVGRRVGRLGLRKWGITVVAHQSEHLRSRGGRRRPDGVGCAAKRPPPT